MDAATFLGVRPSHNRFRWTMAVEPRISNFGGTLFGGAGLAAAIVVLENVTGRLVIWASAQYLSYARTHSVVDLDVKLAVQGHNTTQARVTAHVADAEVLTVNAALGARATPGEGTFARHPVVPPPEDCPPRSFGCRPREASTSTSRCASLTVVTGRSSTARHGLTADRRCGPE